MEDKNPNNLVNLAEFRQNRRKRWSQIENFSYKPRSFKPSIISFETVLLLLASLLVLGFLLGGKK